MHRPLYVVLEGLPRSGKTSNLELAKPLIVEKCGDRVYFTKEPGGTEVGNLLREIVLMSQLKMHPVTEAYIMAAARAELYRVEVVPRLERGEDVVSDRGVEASMTFQGYGRELGVEKVAIINQVALDELKPSLVVLFDIKPETVRIRGQDLADKFESENPGFLKRVRVGYHRRARGNAYFRIIDGEKSLPEVQVDFLKILREYELVN